MERLVEFFHQNGGFVHQWGYLILFAAAWGEGLNSMILGGFVASLGMLNPYGILASMTLGHALSGICWYAVGFYGGAKPLYRWGYRIKLGTDRLQLAHEYFERHGGKAILLTKITVGFTIATLIIAGVVKMRFKKFLTYNFLGSLGWSAITIFFGYSFGLSYRLLLEYVKGFTEAVVFFFVFLGGAIALWHILRWVFRTQLFRALGASLIAVFSNRNDDADGGQRGTGA